MYEKASRDTGDKQIGTVKKKQTRPARRPASKSRTRKFTDNNDDHKNRDTTLLTRCNYCETKQYDDCRHCRIKNHSVAEKPNTHESCNFCDRQRKQFYKTRQEMNYPRNKLPNTSIPPPDRQAFNPPVATPNLTKK